MRKHALFFLILSFFFFFFSFFNIHFYLSVVASVTCLNCFWRCKAVHTDILRKQFVYNLWFYSINYAFKKQLCHNLQESYFGNLVMSAPKDLLSYAPLTKLGKQSHYDEDFDSEFWGTPQKKAEPSQPTSLRQDPYQVSAEPNYADGYDSAEEYCTFFPSKAQPEVNLKNVLGGLVAILTGRNKNNGGTQTPPSSSSNMSFLGSGNDGDSFLHPSVYIPSAPPLLEAEAINYSTHRSVLEAEPPEWLPDSYTTICMQCSAPFSAITRGRHHCRFCGGIFCRACTKGRSLLPVKFRQRDPQRVCDACYDRLDPLQGLLISSISNATQLAKHDIIDWTCARGWLNLPIGLSMEHEIYKAANTLRSYSQVHLLCTWSCTSFVYNSLYKFLYFQEIAA